MWLTWGGGQCGGCSRLERNWEKAATERDPETTRPCFLAAAALLVTFGLPEELVAWSWLAAGGLALTAIVAAVIAYRQRKH